jgi:hypothetical protein
MENVSMSNLTYIYYNDNNLDNENIDDIINKIENT